MDSLVKEQQALLKKRDQHYLSDLHQVNQAHQDELAALQEKSKTQLDEQSLLLQQRDAAYRSDLAEKDQTYNDYAIDIMN